MLIFLNGDCGPNVKILKLFAFPLQDAFSNLGPEGS